MKLPTREITPTLATAPPMSRAEALAVAERCIELLRTRFGARRVIVFGSAAGQGPWHAGSDLDLAVECIRPAEFLDAYGAVQDLAPPNLKVDLVELETAYPEMRARILREVAVPDDPILALQGLVADELTTLERISAKMNELTGEMHDPPTWVEMSAMGRLIHDFYRGAESLLSRIAVQFDGSVSATPHWHSELVAQMGRAQPGKRPAVIDKRLLARLDEYRKLFHFFRNAYGAELEWDRLQKHVVQMSETLDMLRAQLDQFFVAVQPKEERS
ncbi:MAG: nucleotidyltransferase domain-containing protein [Chloroflexi bacterium]|nr:nucleotidyltransferase domain-containing protein [Chloroflexota bacterium]